MKIITGLGNPGKKYELNRHNIGFMVVDEIARQNNCQWQTNKKFDAQICKTDDFILVKPQTMMNNSGQAVRAVLDYYKLLPKTLGLITKKQADLSAILTVIHDDIDIEFKKFKIQTNRSSAGHRGVQSIINHLKTKNFTRVRVGIKATWSPKSNSAAKQDEISKFVLSNFSKNELAEIKKIIPRIIENILKI